MGHVYRVFSTEFGWCGVVAGGSGIVRVYLPESQQQVLEQRICVMFPSAVAAQNGLSEIAHRMQAYFRGRHTDFKQVHLDFTGATGFQRQVWQQTRRVPYGETRTYSWIAGNVNNPNAQRAVGTALGKNPFPVIVPCHRVIRKTGGMGGFSAADGVDMKKKLLTLEAIQSTTARPVV